VRNKYGPGYFRVKQNSPRFRKPIWKGWIGRNDENKLRDSKEQIEPVPVELKRIARKADYLTVGIVGLGFGTAVGFGATALSLHSTNQVLSRAAIAIDSILAANPLHRFLCGTCTAPLASIFDKFCGSCGSPITSPDRRQPASPSEQRCRHCNFPVRQGQIFCRECGKPLQSEPSPRGWSLP
jgi:hypothetical protein